MANQVINKLLDYNVVYMKPQLTVILSLQCNLIYLVILLILIYNPETNFRLLLLPYIIETVCEACMI